MSYVREVLQPGEEIRFRTNVHWLVYLPALVMFVVIYLFRALVHRHRQSASHPSDPVLLKCCGWRLALHTCMAQAVRH